MRTLLKQRLSIVLDVANLGLSVPNVETGKNINKSFAIVCSGANIEVAMVDSAYKPLLSILVNGVQSHGYADSDELCFSEAVGK